MAPTVIVWFRRDLRLSDHPALAQAVAEQAQIVPLFIFDPYLLQHPETGSGRVQFLLDCLDSLQKNLDYLGSTLVRRYGDQRQVLAQVAAEFKADAVYWNDDSERLWRTETDCSVTDSLKNLGVRVQVFRSEALLPAGGKQTYALKTFTPQWYQFLSEPVAPRPQILPPVAVKGMDELRSLQDLDLPKSDQRIPTAGEREAHRLLSEFIHHKAPDYLKSLSVATQASQKTSRLSPHLKFGTMSARTIYQQVRQYRPAATKWEKRNLDGFISRLFWRDHFAQKLRNLPRCETESYLEAFDQVSWSQNEDHYQAWCEGKTGYPLVDAAMRCLNATGWIPFRLRALCATFLCIDLFLPWQWGANHYMNKLIDADVAIDHWQWQSHAGVSNRGRSWFRVYNPNKGISKIDPQGSFIHQWVPELADIPVAGFSTPQLYGRDYYQPLVEHDEARRQALAVLEPIKRQQKRKKKSAA
ncbi:Deoxyribodipyrimidine photo-lyase [Acaryochloris thomasi RCC1774]|uniref:Deoxyribodipyrimidine photo-lyase n=1 Tax=Acaryochloris thomasi RCC1774 TaxID=1764569 RepID=A0A2W1JK02_9CYAN|nr:deoxyribodipyrimidine photo-lyase [Acaryochloris thomasi]PZD73750.1 Deoxyribodipyrimidine photo-lyase [Acaryochloris thomasi RCC1774]